MFNRALIGKWLWRFADESGVWWKKVVEAKYGAVRGGGVLASDPILMVWGYGNPLVGNGCVSLAILDSFLVTVPESAFVRRLGVEPRPLRRSFRGCAALRVIRRLPLRRTLIFRVALVSGILLYAHELGGGEDKIWWVPARKGKFNVCSFYNILISKDNTPFPWKSIWRTKAPPRVAFFAWSAALGKILTLDNLRKMNMVVINRCGMCKVDEESIDHLLLHCECAQFLWNAFFSRFRLAWVMPRGVINLFQCWWMGGRPSSAIVWKMAPLCILWCLWSE
ncbi:uncharacterized protein LOC132162314 [Corylus avellana]|uniref:uncharacterized protein LOC132162314 n=1 Tax=Corylus avellana TaxID=13451 RepID=UPI00286B4DDD|nr:uncharacterized protein LOC132162314 [Corylus avellana]